VEEGKEWRRMHAEGGRNLFGTPPRHHQKLDEASLFDCTGGLVSGLGFASAAHNAHGASAQKTLAEWLWQQLAGVVAICSDAIADVLA